MYQLSKKTKQFSFIENKGQKCFCTLLGNFSEEENAFIKFSGNYSNFKAKQLWSLETKQNTGLGTVSVFYQTDLSFTPCSIPSSSGHNKKMKYIFTCYTEHLYYS